MGIASSGQLCNLDKIEHEYRICIMWFKHLNTVNVYFFEHFFTLLVFYIHCTVISFFYMLQRY